MEETGAKGRQLCEEVRDHHRGITEDTLGVIDEILALRDPVPVAPRCCHAEAPRPRARGCTL